MATTIVTRAGKGSELTHAEVDANFNNLKTTADGAEPAINKSLDIDADQASDVKFPSVKALYDWAIGLFLSSAEIDISGGIVGLTLFKINFKNVANTFTSFLTNTNTAARTYTFPDRSGTMAVQEELKSFNDITNGQFKVAQAGTSFPAAATGDYDLDGWLNAHISSALVTITQGAGDLISKFARIVTVTTADAAVAVGDYFLNTTRIEGYDAVKYVGNTFCLSFKVKSSVTGVHCVQFFADGKSYVAEYTIDVADTWETKSIVVEGGLPGVTSATFGIGFSINWTSMSGTNYHTAAGSWNVGSFIATANQVNDLATIGNVFGLQDVMLNLGKIPAIDTTSYSAELDRCYRYFQNVNMWAYGYGIAGQSIVAPVSFKATMHATPTITITSIGSAFNTENEIVLSVTTNGFGYSIDITATGHGGSLAASATASARL
jgi:hypothetical protein